METLTKNQDKPVDISGAKEYFRNKISFTTGPVELSHWLKEGKALNVIDVRAAEDYREAHVPGAVSLPRERWETFEGLRKDRTNILYCYSQTCHLAASAAVKFAVGGYPVVEMEGGFKAWKENSLETEKS